MKSRFTFTAIAALALCLSLPLAAYARGGECHQNTKLCLQQINSQISKLRAYVAHIKPGDPVEFSQQARESSPQFRNTASPQLRNAMQAYSSLQAELSDLASNSAEIAGLKGSPEKLSDAQGAISDAQNKLSRLGQTADRNAATPLLDELSASVQRLSDATRGQGPPKHFRKSSSADNSGGTTTPKRH